MKRYSKTQYAILGMLSQATLSGYDIKKALKESTQHFWQESDGQIYPMLTQLVQKELIAYESTSHRGQRERRLYQITPKGLATLKDWLQQKAEIAIPRHELLLKLFFGVHNSIEKNQQHLEEYHQQLVRRFEHFEAIEKKLMQETSEHVPYGLMTLRYGKHITQAQLAWCQESLDRLHPLSPTIRKNQS